MVLGILQFELLIHDTESLKDKRRVVQSVKDRLHREHQAAVAEVDALETLNRAVLGLAVVGREGRRVGEVLDQITSKLRSLHDAELGDVSREIVHGAATSELEPTADLIRDEENLAAVRSGKEIGESDRALEREMLERARLAQIGLNSTTTGKQENLTR